MSIVPWVTVALFSLTGLAKLINLPQSVAQRDALQVSRRKWHIIGGLEVAGATGLAGALTGYLPMALGVAAAWGFVLLLIGAMGTRINHSSRDNAHDWMLIADVLTWVLAVATLVVMIRH